MQMIIYIKKGLGSQLRISILDNYQIYAFK
jgi:hypothetical protein